MKIEIIQNILDRLEIPISTIGYKYWIEAISEQTEKSFKDISKIYEQISKKYNTTIGATEKAMRCAYANSKNIIKKYFNINYKITNKMLLILLVKEVQRLSKKERVNMERFDDLENIIDTLSYLIKEIKSSDLKGEIEGFLLDFEQEKDKLEEELRQEQYDYEAEQNREFNSMRI